MKNEYNQASHDDAQLRAIKGMFDNLSPDAQKSLTDSVAPTATHLPQIEEQEGGRTTRWDLLSRLLNDRIVRIDGQVDGAMAIVAQASLQYLNSLDQKKPITMIINSPGGSVPDGLVIYDTMREIKAPVHTQGYGMMASMGSLLLVAGEEGHRSMSKNARIMIHQIAARSEGKLADMEASNDFTEELYEQLVNAYVGHTGVEAADWYNDLLVRDNWISAEEGMKINFIDFVQPQKTMPYEHKIDKTNSVANETNTKHRVKFRDLAKIKIEEIYQARLAAGDNGRNMQELAKMAGNNSAANNNTATVASTVKTPKSSR